ncbi:cell division protein ZapD [Alginatibacterium sediminis]|uniref:Cell division protein ZapD n=1 Tax=Alginatibacterium sediminis TaxID=2164068 RepID=A0A420EJG2_9ALTE|nr:cell division protein ZapD [Alginatibacterium sediminis]RKF20861.1 cell division protein ZapD [Alginatibacterium sediminis]
MSVTVFEHPLNEKVRNYLRLESHFRLIRDTKLLDSHSQQHVFFRSYFELIELLERSDWRGDLVKDLERQKKQLHSWKAHAQVDTQTIDQLLAQINRHLAYLAKPHRFDMLKEDRLLSSVKQRISLPGGCFAFDVPQLHHWLHQERAYRDYQISQWLEPLYEVEHAIELLLGLARQQKHPVQILALKGFYQGSVDDAELLQISIDSNLCAYPTVSGHKHRYAIKFVATEPLQQEDIACSIACCKIA